MFRSILGSMILIVLLGTLFDLYKRGMHHFKSKEMSSNSTVLLNNSDLTDGLNETAVVHDEEAYLTLVSRKQSIR